MGPTIGTAINGLYQSDGSEQPTGPVSGVSSGLPRSVNSGSLLEVNLTRLNPLLCKIVESQMRLLINAKDLSIVYVAVLRSRFLAEVIADLYVLWHQDDLVVMKEYCSS